MVQARKISLNKRQRVLDLSSLSIRGGGAKGKGKHTRGISYRLKDGGTWRKLGNRIPASAARIRATDLERMREGVSLRSGRAGIPPTGRSEEEGVEERKNKESGCMLLQ